MAWTYSQSTGALLNPTGTLILHGFAGHSAGLNNPALQDQKDIGPLPQGKYKMNQYFNIHPTMGQGVIELLPDPTNQMFGRSGFFIHGLNVNDPLHSSDGCAILGSTLNRLNMWASLDHDFVVTA